VPPTAEAVKVVLLLSAPVPQKYVFPEIETDRGGVTETLAVAKLLHPN
jgi:hypothetical protein